MASLFYLVPPAAVLAFLLSGEQPGLVQMTGMALAVPGVALANGRQRDFDTRAAWKSIKTVLDLPRGIGHGWGRPGQGATTPARPVGRL